MTDLQTPCAGGAVRAEISCPHCGAAAGAGPDVATAGRELVVHLPVGAGEPVVSVERDGWTLSVDARDGSDTWEHEVDLPFPVKHGDLTIARRGASLELRIPVPLRRPAAV